MKLSKFGYCAVTADFLHIGHIKYLKKCKQRCENLIVGIMTDDCVYKYKGRKPIMTYEQRKEIVDCLKFVYRTRPQNTFEFPDDIERMKIIYGKEFVVFDCKVHSRKGADIIFPYMEGISSTRFKQEYLYEHPNHC